MPIDGEKDQDPLRFTIRSIYPAMRQLRHEEKAGTDLQELWGLFDAITCALGKAVNKFMPWIEDHLPSAAGIGGKPGRDKWEINSTLFASVILYNIQEQ